LPLYEYKCKSCGIVSEIRHGFKESVSEPCAACGGALTRVFNAAGIVFKGSGFYVNDSRKSSASSNGEKPASAEGSKDASTDASSAGESAKSGESTKTGETASASGDSTRKSGGDAPKSGGDSPKTGPSGKSGAAA